MSSGWGNSTTRKTFFVPEDAAAEQAQRSGKDVRNRCINCGYDFMEHTNGNCPTEDI